MLEVLLFIGAMLRNYVVPMCRWAGPSCERVQQAEPRSPCFCHRQPQDSQASPQELLCTDDEEQPAAPAGICGGVLAGHLKSFRLYAGQCGAVTWGRSCLCVLVGLPVQTCVVSILCIIVREHRVCNEQLLHRSDNDRVVGYCESTLASRDGGL